MNKQELFEKALNEFDAWPFTKSHMFIDTSDGFFVGGSGKNSQPIWHSFVCTREEFEAAKAERSGFENGQEVFIAQINTLAGVEEKRYYIKEYWCGSGNQQQYVELGIIFDNKKDAENKCKELLGIPIDTRTDKEKAVDDFIGSIKCFPAQYSEVHKAIWDFYDKWVGDKK